MTTFFLFMIFATLVIGLIGMFNRIDEMLSELRIIRRKQ